MSRRVRRYLEKGQLPSWSELNGKYRSERSVHGMDFKELLSALQKYIRRSEVEKALWVAVELSYFSSAEDRGKGLRTNFLHRLMIIALEDVGPPVLTIWPALNELFSELLAKPKSRKRELELICQIVEILATTLHSREFSHQRTFWAGYPELEEWIEVEYPEKMELLAERNAKKKPQTSLPKLQTAEKGVENLAKQLFAALERRSSVAFHFAAEILANLGSTAGKHFGNKSKSEYFVLALLEHFAVEQNREDVLELIPVAVKWFGELSSLKEKFLTWYAIIQSLLFENVELEDLPEMEINVEEWLSDNLDLEPIELDDYVVDMHTARGKRSGKNRIDFALEGAKVEDEWEGTDAELKQIYIDNKFIQELGLERFLNEQGFEEDDNPNLREEEDGEVNSESERSRFRLQVRVQLICRKTGQDTYFATDRLTNKKVFVKGPYLSQEAAERPVRVAQLKKYFKGIEAIPLERLELFPDQWDSVPLGCRNQCSPGKKYSFLVADDLNDANYPIRVHLSKLWPETEVVDWAKVTGVTNPDSKLLSNDPKAFENWILNMLFRYIVGIPDVAIRNFLYFPDRHLIFGVDEEGYNREAKLRAGVKKTIADQMQKHLRKYFDQIGPVVENWLEALEQNCEEIEELLRIDISEMIERCETVSKLDGALQAFD